MLLATQHVPTLVTSCEFYQLYVCLTCFLAMLTSACSCKSSFTTSTCPFQLAMKRGVWPPCTKINYMIVQVFNNHSYCPLICMCKFILILLILYVKITVKSISEHTFDNYCNSLCFERMLIVVMIIIFSGDVLLSQSQLPSFFFLFRQP